MAAARAERPLERSMRSTVRYVDSVVPPPLGRVGECQSSLCNNDYELLSFFRPFAECNPLSSAREQPDDIMAKGKNTLPSRSDHAALRPCGYGYNHRGGQRRKALPLWRGICLEQTSTVSG